MGLLDGFSEFARTPEGQGLLAATFGGLASAQRGAPINSLGRAGLAGLTGYGNAQDRDLQAARAEQQRKYQEQVMAHTQMQMDAAKRDAERKATIDAGMGKFFTPAQKAMPALPSMDGMLPQEFRTGAAPMGAQEAKPADFDAGGAAQFLAQNGDYKEAFNLMPKAPEAFTLGEGQTRYIGDKIVAKGPEKQPAMPSAIQEYNFAKGQGYPGTFEQWSTSQKKAGATNVSTRVDTKMGDSLASQVGPMVKDTYTAAQGAVQQTDAAARIIKAVDSGKIIAGPLSGGRLKIAQVGQLLGVTGKDDAETIARSRDVIRGLSEMTLKGRQQMTGQGAITESEGALAEKANSGNIEDLTPAEIKQLARASARASKFAYEQHQDNLRNLNSDPATAKLGGFYKVRPLPAFDYGDQSATPSQSGSARDAADAILRGK